MRRAGTTKLKIPTVIPAAPDRINVYVCDTCKSHIVTIDIHEGVTPMWLPCKHLACSGMAESSMYPSRRPIPVHIGAPQWEWYTPQFGEYINLSSGEREHVNQGGLLLRRRVLAYATA